MGTSFNLNRIWGLEHGSLETNATLFSSELNHAVSLVPIGNTPDRFIFANAQAPTHNVGAEFLAGWCAGPWSVLVTYGYLNATEVRPDEKVRSPGSLNPKHSANLTAAWEKEHLGRIGLECFFTGHQALIDNPYRTTSPSFVTFGVLVKREFGSASVFLKGENLTDRRQSQVDPLLLPTQVSDGRWLAHAWGPLVES